MKKKALSVILSIAMLATPVSASAEEVGFTDGIAMEETVAPEEVDLSGGEASSSADEVSSIEEADAQDVENEPSDPSEEATDIIEEVSDAGEEVSLFEDNYDELKDDDEDYFDDEADVDDREVELFEEPEKTLYLYEEIKSVDDFDLTGLSIKVITDDSEEIISFSRNREKKKDSKGNYYECQVVEDTDDTGEIVHGYYTYFILYEDGRKTSERGISLHVLPSVSTAKNAVRQESGVYTATVAGGGTEVVKLVPEESWKFQIVDMVKRYDLEEEDRGSILVVDGQSMDFIGSSDFIGSVTLDLEKGKTYYLYLDHYLNDDRNVHSLFVNPASQGNSGVCGANAVWNIENGIMTIKGSGPMYGYMYGDSKEWNDVEHVVIEEGITSIGNCMFEKCTKLESVQIAESVEKIGDSAFFSCENLQNILIPKNVKAIGEYVFSNTYKLGDIEVDQDNQYYSTVDGILYNKDQTDLIFVPDSKTECNISAKVVSFAGIDLKTYPYNVRQCRSILGSGNSALQSITVASDNPVITSDDGALYTKDKRVLLACPPKKKSLIVPAETQIIGYGAARDCKELASVSLPEGLKEISRVGFSGCTSLKEITIPEAVIMGGWCFTESGVTLLKVYADSDAERYAKAMGFKYKIVGIHNHSWDASTVTTEATCTDEGILTYTCTVCRQIRTESIAKTSHKEIIIESEDATCERNGETEEIYCSECGMILKEAETIPALGHTWDNGKITREAACTADGKKTFICTACQKTRTEIIPATGHKYGNYTVTKEPTIFAAGTESRECAVCHNREEREIPKLTAQVKLVSKTLPMQVKKSVSGQKLIADKNPSDRIASLTTSNGKVVAVNNKTFKITAKKAGKAVITVAMKSGTASRITVNVKKGKVATTKITGVKKKLTIKKGKKLALKPVLSPITSTDKLAYSSSDEETATVSSKGVIKALKKGKAKIKVKAGKKTVTCVVTVK